MSAPRRARFRTVSLADLELGMSHYVAGEITAIRWIDGGVIITYRDEGNYAYMHTDPETYTIPISNL